MEERNLSGYIMAVTGSIMILINALSYIFQGDFRSPAFTVLGLVLIVIGTATVRKYSPK